MLKKLKRIFARKPKYPETVISVKIIDDIHMQVAVDKVYGPPSWHHLSALFLNAVALVAGRVYGVSNETPKMEEWH